ncbi:hypothetical protein CALVIDRAFT_202561 [Calocera viscosa TUFC12733]|uniref:F-box domain-containing protein n=1 Tax=Calocera viscosa (strain TUFC12733) TaxID=1330018 RepID=A0A167KB13_CALVF|nr:hypothetical protein CALVIDRAFT_202561 [Calocera viscosa TUFC12733]
MTHFYRGQYSSLQSLVLYDTGEDLEETQRLFFLSNGAHLTRIDFTSNGTARTRFCSLPIDSLSDLTHVAVLSKARPTAQWYSSLPSSVRHLHVRAYIHGEDVVSRLVKHLDDEVCGSSGVPFRYIHVDDWSWSDELENGSQRTGLMVGSAHKLGKRRGISLLDEKGLSLELSLKPVSNCALLDG